MARGIEISLVHGDVMLAKWATRLNYVTLSEVQQHVPSGFERGTYKITFRGEDLHSARRGRKYEHPDCAQTSRHVSDSITKLIKCNVQTSRLACDIWTHIHVDRKL